MTVSSEFWLRTPKNAREEKWPREGAKEINDHGYFRKPLRPLSLSQKFSFLTHFISIMWNWSCEAVRVASIKVKIEQNYPLGRRMRSVLEPGRGNDSHVKGAGRGCLSEKFN